MRMLLDSCAFVDLATQADSLTERAISEYQNIHNDCYLSVATVWELGLKKSLGKLSFDIDAAVKMLDENGIKLLDINLPISLMVNKLPYHHKDPFDRIIITTAKINSMQIMTSDDIFSQYGVDIIQSRVR